MGEQPTYEVIKREDLIAAFRSALTQAFEEIISLLHNLIEIQSGSTPSAPWVWDYTSRWDYDVWQS